MIDPMKTLAKRMVETRTIGFIGAGTSARLGYPTWYDLINALYKHAAVYSDVPPPERDSDLRWLAEVYGAEIDRHGSLQQVIRDVLSSSTEQDTTERDEALRLHLLMARLPLAAIVIAYAAWKGQRWLLPIGVLLAMPVIWWGSLALLVACVALKRDEIEARIESLLVEIEDRYHQRRALRREALH